MAENSYSTTALVLRKTKLGESDLIVTLLDSSGELKRAVAKGARKPKSSFAARLELYMLVDLLCATGKNLDIVKEAKLSERSIPTQFDLEQTVTCAPVAELVGRIAQEGLEHPKLFEMTRSAFAHIAVLQKDQALAVSAAALLKAMALSGFRPSYDLCISCGSDVDLSSTADVTFSFIDGGAVCAACQRPADAQYISARTLGWCRALTFSTFDDIVELNVDPSVSFEVLHFARQWVRVHAGSNLKSLDFLFSCGLF